MDELSVYTATPRRCREYIVDCVEAGLVPFVQGSPGIGKSALMRSVSREFGLKLIDHRLSTAAPEDMTGLPHFENGFAKFAPFQDLFPLEGAKLPKADNGVDDLNGWMLFLDEMNSAPKSVQAASYKLVLDRMVGQTPLHRFVAITAAGNLSTDRAIVQSLSTAMQSRLVHIVLEVSYKEWLLDVALPEKYDARILAYLAYKESALLDFKPDHSEHTFCCPRTWEFMNRLIRGKDVKDEKIALYAGTITSTVAVDFVQFTKVFGNLPTIRQVVNDPENLMLPNDPPTQFATITHLLENVEETNFEKVATYINRFPSEFRVLFFRGLMVRHPTWRSNPVFRKALVELDKWLHDDIPSNP